MRGHGQDCGSISVIAPTLSTARAAARALRRRSADATFLPFSLDRLIGSRTAPIRVALCPGGVDIGDDLRFLEDARARLLWPPPPPTLQAAIAGLLGEGAAAATRARASRRRRFSPALLLEGTVTRRRARHALESDARMWIVDRAGHVRLSREELDDLAKRGVRWFALEPVQVTALLAAPALARRRERWRHLLPPRTPVWIWRRC